MRAELSLKRGASWFDGCGTFQKVDWGGGAGLPPFLELMWSLMLSGSRQNDENIRVLTESEARQGWLFVMAVPADASEAAGAEQQIELSLSWQDYEYWSHGMRSPSNIAEVVVRALIQACPDRLLPSKFDASTARRWVRNLDDLVREEL